MMAVNLAEVMKSSLHFSNFELSQIPRKGNEYSDALSKLASTKDADLFNKIVPIELLPKLSISQNGEETLLIQDKPSWK